MEVSKLRMELNSKKNKFKNKHPKNKLDRIISWIKAKQCDSIIEEKLIEYVKKQPSGAYEGFKKNFSIHMERAKKEYGQK